MIIVGYSYAGEESENGEIDIHVFGLTSHEAKAVFEMYGFDVVKCIDGDCFVHSEKIPLDTIVTVNARVSKGIDMDILMGAIPRLPEAEAIYRLGFMEYHKNEREDMRHKIRKGERKRIWAEEKKKIGHNSKSCSSIETLETIE